MRQMLIGVLAAATWAVPLPTSGQRAAQPCAAGWLYVTVVAARGVWVETGAIVPLALQENPPRLLDLCELDGVIQATPPESMAVAALLNGGARPGPGDEVPEFSRVSLTDRSGAFLTELFVEESVAGHLSGSPRLRNSRGPLRGLAPKGLLPLMPRRPPGWVTLGQ